MSQFPPEFAIDLWPELQVVRVRDLLFGHKCADGAENREAHGQSQDSPFLHWSCTSLVVISTAQLAT